MRCRRRPRGLLWPSGGDVETRIADIVGAGFRRWAEFTERFTENEARIRTIDPGAAQWQDLRSLLERSCGAEQGPSATCPIFTLSDYGVDVTHSNVRTLNVFRGTFVCDETEGLPAEDATGRVLQRIGTAYPDVVDAIRSKISELPDDRIGSVRLQRSDQPGWPSPGPSIVLAYALQRIELVGGGAEEREICWKSLFFRVTTGRELFHTPPSANSFVKFVQLKDRQLLTRCSSQKISLMSMRSLSRQCGGKHWKVAT